ncbi:NUDIX hydrolase [Streptomyces sp. NBC_00569]|uniref:NUDIX hydrolase n=1 Tax=Streptomyces sp. NBC_00569 TaxID=2975780 RepID=UPI002E7FC932|nr:NUDIX domain-containing protein [Streptomyces sp. NBC_00569]
MAGKELSPVPLLDVLLVTPGGMMSVCSRGAFGERPGFRGELRLQIQPTISGAVVAHQGKVLLVRRAVPEGSLVWQFPAGKVEPGESHEETAVREALEETGVLVEPLTVIGERLHPVTGLRVVYVGCWWLSGAARAASPREVAEAVWVPFDELPSRIPGGVYEPVWEFLTGPALP